MSEKKLPTWKEMPIGGVILEAGNSVEAKTGAWRVYVPVRDYEKCIHCMACWLVCPDGAVIVENGKVVGTDLEHCKGCGICASVCPPKIACIEMKQESDLGPDDKKG